jgi:cytochrome c2
VAQFVVSCRPISVKPLGSTIKTTGSLEMEKFVKCYACHTLREEGASVGPSDFYVLMHEYGFKDYEVSL